MPSDPSSVHGVVHDTPDRGEVNHIVTQTSTEITANRSQTQDGVERPGSGDEVVIVESQTEPAFSVFTPNQKGFIVFIAAWAGFFSSVAATIYFPALNALARDLHVSDSLINLTLTSYMIFQGLVPPLIGSFADTSGRRPAYFICFTIFIAANIGLALQTSYAALFVLRCLQSAGSSATIAMASAVVADVAPPAERGKYMGWSTGGILISAAVGPILGGILTEFLSWRAIFWFLAIFAGIFFVVFAIFFPETARSKVGNGSIAASGLNVSLMNYLAIRKARAGASENPEATQTYGNAPSTGLKPPRTPINPFAAVKILSEIEGAFVLLSNAFIFMAFYFVTATIPSQFQSKYGYNDLQVGLCYVPWGCGTLISSLATGPLMDRNFQRHCKKAGISVKKGKDQDLSNFPIERARLEIAFPVLYAMCAFLLVFGWVLQINGPVPVLLVLLFLTALSTGAVFMCFNTLLIDLFPKRPATATAANNLVRCLLGAGATALVLPMINGIGNGWAFTILTVFLIATSPMAWVLMLKGMGWRKKRAQHEEEKQRQRDQDTRETLAEEGEVHEMHPHEKNVSLPRKTQIKKDNSEVIAHTGSKND